MSVRDASGRLIQFVTPRSTDLVPLDHDPLCEFRATWYLTMSLFRDGESCGLGAVYVIMDFDLRTVSLDTFVRMARTDISLPNIVGGGHYCYRNPDLTPSVHGFRIMMPEYDRCRLRVHFGDRN